MLNNYLDVQTAIYNFTQKAMVSPGLAPHGEFWLNLSYEDFTTGNVPGINPPWKILVIGDAANSNIIQILSGTGAAADRYGQMPRPAPPYNPEQAALIADLSAWINAGCPNGAELNAPHKHLPHENH